MTPGPIEQLRASKHLASVTTACPPWCDRDHEVTGDDRGVSHQRAIEDAAGSSRLGVHLRAREPVEAPGTLGPTRLVVYSDTEELADNGWFIEIPVDVKRLKTLRDAVDAALAVIQYQAIA